MCSDVGCRVERTQMLQRRPSMTPFAFKKSTYIIYIYISEFVLAFIGIGAIRIYIGIICIYAYNMYSICTRLPSEIIMAFIFLFKSSVVEYFSDDNFLPSKLYLL